MVEDPDALWKPGSDAAAADDEPGAPATSRTIEPTSADGPDRTGLPDRFHPAAGRRRAQRATTAVDTPITATPPVPAAASGPGGWVVHRRAEPPPARRRGRGRRGLAWVLGVVGAIVVAATIAVAVSGDDPPPARPEPDEVAGADRRRLPADVDELWSTVLPGSGGALTSSVMIDGRDLVVAVVDDGSRNRSRVVGVDAATGETRWGRSFSFAPPEVSLLGAIDGVVLVEQNDLSTSRLIGLASADGATLWERQTPGGGTNTLLLGTSVVTDVSAVVSGVLTFVDPSSGEVVGELIGDLLTTDLGGTWYVRTGTGDVVSVDLADGWSEPVEVLDGVVATTSMVVVDGRFLVTDAEGRLAERSAESGDRLIRGADALPQIDSMFPSGGSTFVARNNGEIFGVELDGDVVRVTWKRAASLRSFALTERGLVLSLSDATVGFVDGVDLIVVDGVTGQRLAGTGAVDGLDELPLIVGDGFVTVTHGVLGNSRIGYDLDGTAIWELPVTGKLRVGDELVVVMDNTPSGFRLTAYGAAR